VFIAAGSVWIVMRLVVRHFNHQRLQLRRCDSKMSWYQNSIHYHYVYANL
jgi:hypothetical protein